jgi:hypothetical protein
MLYDPTLESWSALGVRGQPTAILFDADGTAHFVWYGPFAIDDVLEAASTI